MGNLLHHKIDPTNQGMASLTAITSSQNAEGSENEEENDDEEDAGGKASGITVVQSNEVEGDVTCREGGDGGGVGAEDSAVAAAEAAGRADLSSVVGDTDENLQSQQTAAARGGADEASAAPEQLPQEENMSQPVQRCAASTQTADCGSKVMAATGSQTDAPEAVPMATGCSQTERTEVADVGVGEVHPTVAEGSCQTSDATTEAKDCQTDVIPAEAATTQTDPQAESGPMQGNGEGIARPTVMSASCQAGEQDILQASAELIAHHEARHAGTAGTQTEGGTWQPRGVPEVAPQPLDCQEAAPAAAPASAPPVDAAARTESEPPANSEPAPSPASPIPPAAPAMPATLPASEPAAVNPEVLSGADQ
eukprot:gene17578-20930_t